jgi:dTDP-4-dehydrorhamnose 3,5-epimerase
MIFRELDVDGCFEVTPESHIDHRGHFARTFCHDELGMEGLDFSIAQINSSHSNQLGTLRGLHFQSHSFAEIKLVRATRGSAFDLALDLRQGSPTYGRWSAITISAERSNMLYVPRGCAHAILTLESDTTLLYAVSSPYTPSHEGGVRWDDPMFKISWPVQPQIISDKDQSWPLWRAGDFIPLD